MSRYAVRLYVAALVATATPTMVVWDHIPKGADQEDSFLIRQMLDSEKRSTMGATLGTPRNQGQKEITHHIMAEMLTVSPDEQAAAYQMDAMLQGLKAVLRATPLPVAITDAVSGEVSEVVGVGEDIDVVEHWTSQLSEESVEGQAWESLVVDISLREMVKG